VQRSCSPLFPTHKSYTLHILNLYQGQAVSAYGTNIGSTVTNFSQAASGSFLGKENVLSAYYHNMDEGVSCKQQSFTACSAVVDNGDRSPMQQHRPPFDFEPVDCKAARSIKTHCDDSRPAERATTAADADLEDLLMSSVQSPLPAIKETGMFRDPPHQ
jgi:hypothetical protein